MTGRHRPLKPASYAALQAIAQAPVALAALNPGVVDKLRHERLAEVKVPRGTRRFLAITEIGRARLAELEGRR